MSDEKNFDDIMRQKMSEEEFPFSETNWEKAETIIIAAEKKRKRRIIFLIFFLGALVGAAFMVPFVFNQKEVKEANSMTIAEKGAGERENIAAQQKSNSILSANERGNNIEQERQNNREETSNQQENENREGGEVNDKMIEKKVSLIKEDRNNETASLNSKNNKQVNNKDNRNNKPIISGSEKDKKTDDKEYRNSELASLYSKNGKQINRKDNQNHVTEIPSKGKQHFADENISAVKKEKSEKENSTTAIPEKQNNQPALNQTVKQSGTNDSIAALNTIKKDTAQNKADSTIKNKVDSTDVMPITENKKKEDPKQQKNFFSVDVGTNYSLGWKNNTHTEAAGFNFLAGLSFTHYFNQHWSVLMGADYNNLSHLAESYATANTQYGFGYTKSTTVITPKTLHYLAIPIKMQYNINPKNILALGVTPMFLLNSNSTVDTDTQGDYITTSHTTKTKSGYVDGLNSWDMQISLAYRRRFYKRFVLSAEVYYGLLDIRYNSYWGNNISENNRGFKLTLTYNFIK